MIDRRELVGRHAVVLEGLHPDSPLSVGNGELCFTVDLTGLQSLPGAYPLPERSGGVAGTLLGTQAQWGWHTIPPPGGEPPEPTRRWYATRRGPVPYVDFEGPLEPAPGQAPAGDQWLRANPHRLDLVRIGFGHGGGAPGLGWRPLGPDEPSAGRQRLDLWSGRLESNFSLRGVPVGVRTLCHPQRDLLAVRARSGAFEQEGLCVGLSFPYGSSSWNNAAEWGRPEAHETAFSKVPGGWRILRSLDGTRYALALACRTPGRLRQLERHLVVVEPTGPELELVVELVPVTGAPPAGPVEGLPSFEGVEMACARHWAAFWSSGAALDLAGSADPRAGELERRVVLSQYLTAIHCAGSLPPQETGLLANSWYGRFHLEMHWWHCAHFALWGRPELLERSLGFYPSRLEVAQELARGQGYTGARWPKQVGPDGREGPSPISSFLVWQQPHPIYLAELVWRCHRSPETLERYAAVVLESASFMADFAELTAEGFALGPPLVPAQECYAAERGRLANPTFELAYWAFGLELAQRWRERLGLAPDRGWARVAASLVRPASRGGTYPAIAVPPYLLREDHPSMLLALGFLPASPLIDPGLMGATLDDVLARWDWESAWGWDFPALAMTATRLGRPEQAVGALAMDAAKNRYLPSGHNPQSPTLPAYLPANGGLLAAVALMAGGFEGAPGGAVGFPGEGWTVDAEGFPGAP